MSELRISGELSLPRDAATWVFAFLAKRGAGKTYNAAVLAEEMLKAGVPIGVIDGMGIWWGLRASADGKGAGLPIVVFGGEHADLPLVPEQAAEIARAIVESNISFVLDLSGFSKTRMRKVLTAFLDELYRLNRVERHVFIEESDMFAPQKPFGPEAILCLSSVDTFIRRGGNRNLGCTLITQRTAVLNKDVLTQSDCLVVLRTLAPQDKKAIQEWVKEQTDENEEKLKAWYDSLKSLENGEGYVWHPEPPVIDNVKVRFRERETFHATREFIKDPAAARVKLMDASVFIAKFRAVFQDKSALMPSTSAQQSAEVSAEHIPRMKALEAEVEEFRSGRKLAESVRQRLKFLSEAKLTLEEQVKADVEDLKLYDELRSVLRRILPTPLPTALPSSNMPESKQQVSLQATTTIIDVTPAEKQVVINTDSVPGKILFVAKKGKLDAWTRLGDIVKAIQDERWNVTTQQVNNALTELVKAGLVAKKHTDRNYFCLAQGVTFKEVS